MGERFARLLSERSDTPPISVARAPGRVNLIGDHVDYCGGLVLPIAIPQACHAAVVRGRGGPGVFGVVSTGRDEAVLVPTGSPIVPGRDAAVGSWASYVIGAVAEVADDGGLAALSGCEVVVHSEVPIGAGLSSSAALEVSVALAAAGAMGRRVSGLDLARRCQRAEHRFAGMPCGLMDQAASVLGCAGHALLLDCATETPRQVAVPEGASFVVIDSGVRHELAGGAYAERRARCEAAGAALGVAHLARADPEAAVGLAEGLREVARHVITETDRVRCAVEALESGDLAGVGSLMLASHASLRDDFGVSCAPIDGLVERVAEVEGVLGVRMTGGGFGGSVVALVRRGSEGAVRAAAERCRDACPGLAVFLIRPSAGAALVG